MPPWLPAGDLFAYPGWDLLTTFLHDFVLQVNNDSLGSLGPIPLTLLKMVSSPGRSPNELQRVQGRTGSSCCVGSHAINRNKLNKQLPFLFLSKSIEIMAIFLYNHMGPKPALSCWSCRREYVADWFAAGRRHLRYPTTANAGWHWTSFPLI